MDWLLTHESDPDIDAPLSDEEEGTEDHVEDDPEENREVDFHFKTVLFHMKSFCCSVRVNQFDFNCLS